MGPRLLRVDPDKLDKMLTLILTAAVSPISSRRTQPGRLTPVLDTKKRPAPNLSRGASWWPRMCSQL